MKKSSVWSIAFYKGSYKYLLARDITYATGIRSDGFGLRFCSISPDGDLTILAGYAWDGPSGPTIDTRSFMRGSLFHDALYQLLRETGFGQNGRGDPHEIRRHQSDVTLREVCLADGMWKLRARWVYRGVRVGGGPAAAVKARKIHTAP